MHGRHISAADGVGNGVVREGERVQKRAFHAARLEFFIQRLARGIVPLARVAGQNQNFHANLADIFRIFHRKYFDAKPPGSCHDLAVAGNRAADCNYFSSKSRILRLT